MTKKQVENDNYFLKQENAKLDTKIKLQNIEIGKLNDKIDQLKNEVSVQSDEKDFLFESNCDYRYFIKNVQDRILCLPTDQRELFHNIIVEEWDKIQSNK